MPRTKFGSLPTYRLHRASRQAVVTINGKDHYLGAHGSVESRETYERLIAEHLVSPTTAGIPGAPDLTISELILAYHKHGQDYYRDAPKERNKIRLALKPLRALYGTTKAAAFRPLGLQAFRESLLQPKKRILRRTVLADGKLSKVEKNREYSLSRRTVNMRVDIVRRMFKWAVAQELVNSSVFEGLKTVPGLKKGRSSARDDRVVHPVSEVDVTKTLPHVSRHIRGMIEFQMLTGARSGEICSMRPCDIDRTQPVWKYAPSQHKTKHRGHDRLIYIGPKAQEALSSFLNIREEDYVFSPRRCTDDRYAALRLSRKSKVQPSQTDRKKRSARRKPGIKYTPTSYHHAIRAGCKKAKIAPWHPHQLRHLAATRLREEFGVEVARIVLGHRHLSVTEIYAEPNRKRAEEAMGKAG